MLNELNNTINQYVFICETCIYETVKKTDYIKHLCTQKHLINCNPCLSISTLKKKIHICICRKKYCDYSGLWRHKQKCLQNKEYEKEREREREMETSNDNLIVDKLTSLIMDITKQNQEVVKQNNEIANKITNNMTQSYNSINSNNHNNKTFNLNVFLNETCKDAMNMSEFINSLHIDYEDFERVGEIGFVNGISNIIIKNLKELDITQRPLHCTDKKREILYVKEDNKWHKEDENCTKTRKIIKKAADKNTRMIPEFKKRHPDCGEITSKYSDKYDLLIIETMGGFGESDYEKETKILKNITREVVINKYV
jgi:hypothetical protein